MSRSTGPERTAFGTIRPTFCCILLEFSCHGILVVLFIMPTYLYACIYACQREENSAGRREEEKVVNLPREDKEINTL